MVNVIKALRLDDGSLITDRTEMAEEFNTFFKSVFSTKDEINDIEVAPRTAKSFILDIDKSFSQYELTKRFASLEPRKAAGPDEFNPYVLRECAKSLALPLQFIFKKSFIEMRLPKIWKRANVTPLFKAESKLNVKNYRPVSLTCIPGKSMERVIRDGMVEYLVENYLICKEQHGFMPFKSCVTNLTESLDIITCALNEDHFVDVVFTDFSKAFDRVNHKLPLAKLGAYGFDKNTIGWIQDFLVNREHEWYLEPSAPVGPK